MKRFLSIVWFLLWPASFIFAGSIPRESYKIRTVVIDPGHGGHDAGCLGSSAKEKNVALEISLKLGKLIEQTYPDIKVIFTRKTDVFIPLHERAEIANRNHADLFICIHLNSGNKSAYGAETYVMGLHKTEDNLNVAKRENASILLEDDYKTQYDGFDPNSPEANIIFSLYQNQFMHQSIAFASKIQDQFEEYGGRNNRGIKQAGFLVLYKTAMPAVLVESGFLTHNMEEKYLNSDRGQVTISTSIFRAFKEYKLDMESSGADKIENVPPDKTDVKTVTEKPAPVKETAQPEKKDTSVAVIKNNTPNTKTSDTAAKQIPVTESIQETKKDTPVVIHKPVYIPPKPPVAEDKKPVIEENKPPAEEKEQITEYKKPETATKPNLAAFYTVQVGASMNPSKDDANFKSNEVRGIKCADGYTRYVSGTFSTMEDARKHLAKVKSGGRKDAFITAFKGDQKISVQEAAEILKTQ